MAHHFSTEGCSKQFHVRRRRKVQPDPLEELDGTKAKKSTTSTYVSLRPDVDGNIPKLSKSKRIRKKPKQGIQTSASEQDVPHVLQNAEDNMANINQDPEGCLDDLLNELQKDETLKPSAWTTRQENMNFTWATHRSFMFNRLIEGMGVDLSRGVICYKCHTHQAVLKCVDCTGMFLCSECDHMIHSCNPLHDRMTWENDSSGYLPSSYPLPVTSLDFECSNDVCNCQTWQSISKGKFIVITTKGRFDIPKEVRKCDECGNEERLGYHLSHILLGGFWPAKPDLTSEYIFDMKVLELWHHVYRHMPGSSLSGFCRSLCDISEEYGREGTINQTLFSRVIAEYGYFLSEIAILKHQDPMTCPACYFRQHTIHIDGNHKLYRYKHVNRGSRKQYYEGKFIAVDEDVTKHLHDVYEARPPKGKSSFKDIYCGSSRWKAARETTNRNQKLDETGLVVAGCRHALMQKAVNMFAGELYGYAHYLHINFVMPNNIKFMFQDIMCKYWPWAIKLGVTSSLWQSAVRAVKPALSVFHAKAHAWHCQISWGGRYVDGVGGGSGEDMEQAFSHLSRLGVTTKHMNTATRADTITDHVLFWNGRKIKALPELLSRRFKQTKETHQKKGKKVKMDTDSSIMDL